MSELKPCPFCGATHALTVDNLAGDDWYVECEACKVQQHAIYPTDSAAIAAWNRRASGVAMPAKCEADRVAVMSDKLFEQIEYAVLAKTHTGDGAQLDEAKAKFVQLAASHQRLKEALTELRGAMRFRSAVLTSGSDEKLDFANERVWQAEDKADAALKDAP